MDLQAHRKQILIGRQIRQAGINFESACWLTLKELEEYENQRKRIVNKLKLRGVSTRQRNKTIFKGQLLPGCKLCKSGDWICLYITKICNRSCFFCSTQTKKDEIITVGFKKIKNERDLVDYINKRKAKGCGISGGEPLKVLSRTIRYISCMRKELGSSFHIWLYTNGDYVDRRTLKLLKDAGLNEIRFNLVPNNYRTNKVKEAVNIFDHVVVEIPIISKDYNEIIGMINKLEKIGVKYLNLHEMAFTRENFDIMKKKGYRGFHLPSLRKTASGPVSGERPVYGSEAAGFRILEYALKNKLSMNINYCSYLFKHDVQILHIRKGTQKLLKQPHERVTRDGFCQVLVIYETRNKVNKIIKDLERSGVHTEEMYYNKGEGRLEVHPRNLKLLNLLKCEVGLVKLVKSFRDKRGTEVDLKIV